MFQRIFILKSILKQKKSAIIIINKTRLTFSCLICSYLNVIKSNCWKVCFEKQDGWFAILLTDTDSSFLLFAKLFYSRSHNKCDGKHTTLPLCCPLFVHLRLVQVSECGEKVLTRQHNPKHKSIHGLAKSNYLDFKPHVISIC